MKLLVATHDRPTSEPCAEYRRRGDVLIAKPDSHVFSEREYREFLVVPMKDDPEVLSADYHRHIRAKGPTGWNKWSEKWLGWMGLVRDSEAAHQRFHDKVSASRTPHRAQQLIDRWTEKTERDGVVRVARWQLPYCLYQGYFGPQEMVEDPTVSVAYGVLAERKWLVEPDRLE